MYSKSDVRMLLFCIDIGIVNMGVAFIKVSDHDDMECILADRIDITDFKCDERCTLNHSAVMADWISHMVSTYKEELDQADKVLIERQPPMGHRCAEQLLFHKFRHKAVLIHPRSFHCHFNISRLGYEDRKRVMVSQAKRLFESSSNTAALYQERAHDVADAMMLAVYYANQPENRHKFYTAEKTKRISDIASFLNQFAYKPSLKKRRKTEHT